MVVVRGIFKSPLTNFADLLLAPAFYSSVGYGAICFITGTIAAITLARGRPIVKAAVVLSSLAWGLFVGFLAGCIVFPIIAGIYVIFPLPMTHWSAAVWGLGLVVMLQIIAIIRRLYVYV